MRGAFNIRHYVGFFPMTALCLFILYAPLLVLSLIHI